MKSLFRFCALLSLVFLIGCASEKKTDYTAYLQRTPRSLVVLPPLNETTNVRAPDAFLATISMPLAEKGYYVFPVAIVDHYMKENGLPTPGEMHQVSPKKIGEVFGADAVLYITIKTWTTTYAVIDSSTIVKLEYHLVDAKTATPLWQREQVVQWSSSQGQSSIIGMAVAAAVHAASDVDGQHERELAVLANELIINDKRHGMLCGPLSPDYSSDRETHLKELNKS